METQTEPLNITSTILSTLWSLCLMAGPLLIITSNNTPAYGVIYSHLTDIVYFVRWRGCAFVWPDKSRSRNIMLHLKWGTGRAVMRPHDGQPLWEEPLNNKRNWRFFCRLFIHFTKLLLFCHFLFISRFNAIDMKYQVWKLGVVFTDNVSSLSSFNLACLCIPPHLPLPVLHQR